VTKPLNESSNSNQSQTPYEFINRKSGFFSKYGSAAIAVGSPATAFSIAVPSFGAFVLQRRKQRLMSPKGRRVA
jgi:hypothetical protein